MQISQFKTQADFINAAPPPEGCYLRFVKRNGDGSATEFIKDHTGTVRVLNAGDTGGAAALADLTDVAGISGAADKQALAFDAASGKWTPQTIESGGGSGAYTPGDGISISAEKVISADGTVARTAAVDTALEGKVDKVDGKVLSSNDYTTDEKNKLAELANYDDTGVRGLISEKPDNLADLNDVSGAADAEDGQALVYDAENEVWVPGTVSGGSGGDGSGLPANPSHEDIPIFNAEGASGGGNDEDTQILLHFDEAEFKNTAKGNPEEDVVTNGGAVVLAENGKFGKCAYFPGADATSNLVIDYTAEQLNAVTSCRIDFCFKLDGEQPSSEGVLFESTEYDGDRHALLVRTNGGATVVIALSRYDNAYVTRTGGFDWVTFVKYDSKWHAYFNGARVLTDVTYSLYPGNLHFGNRVYYGQVYSCKGWVDEFRVQLGDMSEFVGDTIPVPAEPFSELVLGKWELINKSNLGGEAYTAGSGIDITDGVINVDETIARNAALATVATTGSYDDLTDKPELPDGVTEITVSASSMVGNDAHFSIDIDFRLLKGFFYFNFGTDIPVIVPSGGGSYVFDLDGDSFTVGTNIVNCLASSFGSQSAFGISPITFSDAARIGFSGPGGTIVRTYPALWLEMVPGMGIPGFGLFFQVTKVNVYGNLPVTMGGTGLSTVQSGVALIGNGTSPLATRPISTSPVSGSANLVTSGGIYNALLGKVDKVEGKGLSANDYTTPEKTKLAGLENYDDTEVRGLVAAKPDAADIAAAVSAHNADDEAHADIRSALEAKANTADLAAVATTGSYNDLSDKPDISSSLTAGDGIDITDDEISADETIARKSYVDEELEDKADTASLSAVAFSGDYADLLNPPSIPEALSAGNGIDITDGQVSVDDTIPRNADLATVAATGSYSDLADKPEIPAALADLTDVSGTEEAADGQALVYDAVNGVWIPGEVPVSSDIRISDHPITEEDAHTETDGSVWVDIERNCRVFGVIMPDGAYYPFKGEEIHYSEGSASIDITRCLQERNVSEIDGTWTAVIAAIASGDDIDLAILAHNSDEEAHADIRAELSGKADTEDLAEVAFSGDYEDLINVPAPVAGGIPIVKILTLTENVDWLEMNVDKDFREFDQFIFELAPMVTYNGIRSSCRFILPDEETIEFTGADTVGIFSDISALTYPHLKNDLIWFYKMFPSLTTTGANLVRRSSPVYVSTVTTPNKLVFTGLALMKDPVIPSMGGTGRSGLPAGQVLVGNGNAPVTTKVIDTEVTAESTNLITSGAVHARLTDKANISSLSTVATTGSYNDLTDKPFPGERVVISITSETSEGFVVARLDDVFDEIELYDTAVNIVSVEMTLRSANPDFSGNIVLIPIVNNVEKSPVVVEVSDEWDSKSFALSVDVGSLRIKRDHGNELDTLKDGSSVVTVQIVEVRYRRSV